MNMGIYGVLLLGFSLSCLTAAIMFEVIHPRKPKHDRK